MPKYNINNFYKLKRGDVLPLNQSDYSIYKDMVQNINATPIKKYYEIQGIFLDILFVCVVRSMSRTETESGKLLGRLTLEDNSGELSIFLFEEEVKEIYKLDLDVPIKIVLRISNNTPPSLPAYKFVGAMDLSS
jgi:DNA polymerase III alpha subunit